MSVHDSKSVGAQNPTRVPESDCREWRSAIRDGVSLHEVTDNTEYHLTTVHSHLRADCSCRHGVPGVVWRDTRYVPVEEIGTPVKRPEPAPDVPTTPSRLTDEQQRRLDTLAWVVVQLPAPGAAYQRVNLPETCRDHYDTLRERGFIRAMDEWAGSGARWVHTDAAGYRACMEWFENEQAAGNLLPCGHRPMTNPRDVDGYGCRHYGEHCDAVYDRDEIEEVL